MANNKRTSAQHGSAVVLDETLSLSGCCVSVAAGCGKGENSETNGFCHNAYYMTDKAKRWAKKNYYRCGKYLRSVDYHTFIKAHRQCKAKFTPPSATHLQATTSNKKSMQLQDNMHFGLPCSELSCSGIAMQKTASMSCDDTVPKWSWWVHSAVIWEVKWQQTFIVKENANR